MVAAAPDLIFRKTRPMFVINQRNAFYTGGSSSNTSGISNNNNHLPTTTTINNRLEDLSRERVLDDKKAREAMYAMNGILDKNMLSNQQQPHNKSAFSISRSLHRRRIVLGT